MGCEKVGKSKEEKQQQPKRFSIADAQASATSHGYSLEPCRAAHGFWQVFDPRYGGNSFPCAKTATGALEKAREGGADIPPVPKTTASEPDESVSIFQRIFAK